MKIGLDPLLSLPARRPRLTLAIAGALTLVAIAGAARLSVKASLDAMFPRHDPAAQALAGVMTHFQAADELLVLATLPSAEKKPDPDRLIGYAGRFEHAVASTAVGGLAGAVIYRTPPDAERFIAHELVPAGMLYLDDAELAAARQRLSLSGMRAQLSRDQAMLTQPGPAAGALAKAMMQDPLFLHDFLLPRLAASRPMATYQNSDALIAPDGKALLIRVLGKRPPTDLAYAAAFSDAIRAAAAAALPDGINVQFAGAYPIAALSQQSIRRDAIESVISSVALLAGLFALVYRRPIRMFHLAFIPVALGTLWGFGAYGLTRQNLSPIAAVIGGVLAAMGIDYSTLYLTRYQTICADDPDAGRAARRTLNEIGTALLAAYVTSVAGFLAIAFSSVQALRDFAILGTFGLTGSFLAVLFVLPALLVLGGRSRRADRQRAAQPAFRFEFHGLMRWGGRHWVALSSAGSAIALVCVVAAARGPALIQPDADLTVMHPHPNAALDAELEIGRRFGISAGTMLIDLHAADDQKLLTLACEVQRRLATPQIKAAGIAGVYGLATWLPDPAVASARRARLSLRQAAQAITDFNAAVADSPFDIRVFEGYRAFLGQLLNPSTVPDVATLRRYPGLAGDLLAAGPTAEALTVVFMTGSEESRTDRDRAIDAAQTALRGLNGAILTGLPVVSHDADEAVSAELPRLLAIAAALIAGYLLVHFRNPRHMLLSLLPAAFGMATLAAISRYAGIRLNMVDLVALPLLIGIDVDYGIYLVSLARSAAATGQIESAVSSGAHAVAICAASMIAGYASLMLTSVPAVQSLGLVVAAGVASCLAGALLLLCPLLLKRAQ